MEKFTPEYAEAISGVDRNLIVQAARMYATAKNAAIYWALGIPEHSHGTDNAHVADSPGAAHRPHRPQGHAASIRCAGKTTCRARPIPARCHGTIRAISGSTTKRRRANSSRPGISSRAGSTAARADDHGNHERGQAGRRARAAHHGREPDDVRAQPEPHATHDANSWSSWSAQDLFINESGAYADVFLPAASWAEKDGTFTNTDRRVQRVRKAIEPRGQSRPDWEIICDLADADRKEARPRATRLLGLQTARPKCSRNGASGAGIRRRDISAHREAGPPDASVGR